MSRSTYRRRVAATLLAAVTLAAYAPAQEDAPGPRETDPADVERLWQRGREVLHPGEPLDLVGSEQGGNDFRGRTPALERSDRQGAQVDLDVLRERKLAMYSGAQTFSAPPPPAAPPGVAPDEWREAPVGADSPDSFVEEEPAEHEFWAPIVSALLALLGLAGWVWRGRVAA
ncbi:MAG: hypothetical protein H6828_16665 [Planctomycetes bacterium]|nr:hypothetical protein [Planctomycetota bacterium]